jgi:hypothetical protein
VINLVIVSRKQRVYMDINYGKWKPLEWELTRGNSRAGGHEHNDQEHTDMGMRAIII